MFGNCSNYVVQIDLYIEHYEHLRDTVKQLHHIAPTQNQQIRTKHAHFCISIFAPMLLNAVQTLINHFNPKIDCEMLLTNYQVFFDFWIQLYIDIYDLFCLIVEQTGLRKSDKFYPPLPSNSTVPINNSTIQQQPSAVNVKTTVQSTNSAHTVPSNIDTTTANQNYKIPEIVEPIAEEAIANQPTIDKTVPSNYCANCCACERSRTCCCNRQSGNAMNPAQMAELARKRLEENEIVEKCNTMTKLVQTMMEFTNGLGELKTTQDLFTHAENYGEEANKFYKIVRYLTYQVCALICLNYFFIIL